MSIAMHDKMHASLTIIPGCKFACSGAEAAPTKSLTSTVVCHTSVVDEQLIINVQHGSIVALQRERPHVPCRGIPWQLYVACAQLP